MRKKPETLFHPSPEQPDDTSRVADNGGYAHLANALDEDFELFFKSGEDSDGDPNDPANLNSRGYNAELDDTDEPLDLHDGRIIPLTLDQVADIQPASERPKE